MSRLRRGLHRCVQALWRLTRPVTVGVRVVLVREGRVLLVRHTYQDRWYLPGGGVKRGETLEEAVRREAREEVGATLGALRLLGLYTNLYEGKSDHVAVFSCAEFTLGEETEGGEIERAAFHELGALPPDASPGTRRRLREYVSGGSPNVGRW